MHDKDEVPDPQMKIAVLASLSPQEAPVGGRGDQGRGVNGTRGTRTVGRMGRTGRPWSSGHPTGQGDGRGARR